MKKITLITSLLFCMAIYSHTKAQVKYSFMSLNEKYEFNLPQFNLSIPLPANTGFRTPQIPDKKMMLDINIETIYCFDLDQLGKVDGAGQIIFSVPHCNDYYLYLHIKKLPIADFYKKKRELSEHAIYRLLPGLKTKLNKETYSITDSNNDFHYIHHEDYLFCFRILSETPEKIKKQYLNIIKNMQSKDLRNELLKYENRIKYGYFDEKKNEGATDPKSRKFPDWEGKTDKETTFVWDLFDIQMTIPANWKYRANALELRNENANTHIVMDSLDIYYNPMMMTWFTSDSLTFTIRSYTQAAKVNMEDMIKHMTSMVSYTVQKTIVIDGIAMPVTLYGTKEMASIDTYYEADGIAHWLSFGGVTQQTLPLADKILSSIKINQPQLKNKASKNSCNTLSQCFEMKELSPVELDEPFDIPYIDESKTIECSLPNINARLRILAPENQWLCSVGNDRVEIKDGIIEAVPVNNTDKRLSIYSTQPLDIYYNISKLGDDSPMDMKTYTENFKRGYSSYKAFSIMHASVTSINDRLWSIFIYKQENRYIGLFTTANSEYEFLITAIGTSYDDIVSKAGYIRMIEF